LIWSVGIAGAPSVFVANVAEKRPSPIAVRLIPYLTAPGNPLNLGAAIVNALSERLVVSTIHDGALQGRVQGGLVSLSSKTATKEPLGTNWLAAS
jgi:hypothetical protein